MALLNVCTRSEAIHLPFFNHTTNLPLNIALYIHLIGFNLVAECLVVANYVRDGVLHISGRSARLNEPLTVIFINVMLLLLPGLSSHALYQVLISEYRVTIRPLVRFNLETDEDRDSSCALHRLPATRDDSYDAAGLISRQIDTLGDLFVVLNQLFPNDGLLLVLGLAGLQQTRYRSDFLEKVRLRLKELTLALIHLAR